MRRPAARFLERLLHHVERQRADQAGGLGDLDERVGLEEAAGRRAPAGKRLEADQLAGRKVDQRLEEGDELVAEDAAADVLLELEPVGQLALEVLVEPGEAVAPGALGRIERDVALAEHVLLALRAADRGEADRYRDHRLGAAQEHRGRELGDDRLGDRFGRGFGRAVQEHGELVAADPRAAGGLGTRALHRVGKTLEQLVAGKVAVEIVDALEMVEVEQQQDARALRLEHVLERAHQLAAVGKAGVGVGVGVALGQPFGRLIGVERVLQVLRTAPAEQDDGDVEQERDRQRAGRIGRRHAAEGRRQDLAPDADEQQQRRDRRATGDQMAAGDADSLAPSALHPVSHGHALPHCRPVCPTYVKILLPKAKFAPAHGEGPRLGKLRDSTITGPFGLA